MLALGLVVMRGWPASSEPRAKGTVNHKLAHSCSGQDSGKLPIFKWARYDQRIGRAIISSLRAKRSNPLRRLSLDCFVASFLAMTRLPDCSVCSRCDNELHYVRLRIGANFSLHPAQAMEGCGWFRSTKPRECLSPNTNGEKIDENRCNAKCRFATGRDRAGRSDTITTAASRGGLFARQKFRPAQLVCVRRGGQAG